MLNNVQITTLTSDYKKLFQVRYPNIKQTSRLLQIIEMAEQDANLLNALSLVDTSILKLNSVKNNQN